LSADAAIVETDGGCRGENYFRADIAAGRLGPDQADPRREFD
jgi:hypothetical protein